MTPKDLPELPEPFDHIFTLYLTGEEEDVPVFSAEQFRAGQLAAYELGARSTAPIDMVLHCPACGLQHIDAPEDADCDGEVVHSAGWDNPPHKSHLCHGCGHIWRPADVPTNGVEHTKTVGKDDSIPVGVLAARSTAAQPVERAVALLREAVATLDMWADVAPAVSLRHDINRFLGEVAAAAQPVEPTVTPTEAVVGFASWVTCRPGTLPAGEGHDAAPWSEAVHEFVVAQGWPTVRDVFPHNLKRPPLSAPPAASGDSPPPSAPVQGDPSGALRHRPEAVGQDSLSLVARDVLAERRRQVEVEGWTPEHDDDSGVMAIAAACYAIADRGAALSVKTVRVERLWEWTGWAMHWFKPDGRRQNLVRAGALILAEIERLDRKPEPPQAASVERGD